VVTALLLWTWPLADAKHVIADRIQHHNTVRLHSTIGYVPPVGYELRYAREGMAAA
jgi:putative transposase